MIATIYKDFTFEACHWLPNVEASHKCSRPHGHSYSVRLYVQGDVDPHMGWVVDFADITRCWGPLHALLDHRTLNDVGGLKNPTSELLAVWIWERLKPSLSGLCRVDVSETRTSGCSYEGE